MSARMSPAICIDRIVRYQPCAPCYRIVAGLPHRRVVRRTHEKRPARAGLCIRSLFPDYGDAEVEADADVAIDGALGAPGMANGVFIRTADRWAKAKT